MVDTFPGEIREDGEDLARVFAATVAASFPISGTSASFAYRLDPATDVWRRLEIPLGPVFSERVETVGYRRLSLAVNYLLVCYDAINGQDLDSLVSNDPTGPGAHIEFPAVPVGEPVAGIAQIDLEAQIATMMATYGATPDLDINISLPVVRTFLRADTTFIAPDPRAPPDLRFFGFTQTNGGAGDATGVGDVLLRLKYVFLRNPVADLAGGLGLSLPTGSRADFQGTGDTAASAALYASHTYARRIQPHLNLAFVVDLENFDRSQVRYSAGADVRVFDWLTLNNDFLGRSDVASADQLSQPVFVQIERSDVLQFSTGVKLAPRWNQTIWARGVAIDLFFNALLPLNQDGLRADQVLSAGLEAVF